MNENFHCAIQTEPEYRMGDDVLLTFEITNISESDYYLLTWDTPLDHELTEYLVVKRGNKLIRYDGKEDLKDRTKGRELRAHRGWTDPNDKS